MTTAIATFLRVYDHSPTPPDDGTRKLWQNFFVGKVINGHVFEPFEISDVIMNRTADEGGISLTCSPLQQNLEFFVASVDLAVNTTEGDGITDLNYYTVEAVTEGQGGQVQLVLIHFPTAVNDAGETISVIAREIHEGQVSVQ